jgi:ABC-type branched-subunit amino acid transport system substrate-binding protein
VDAIYLGVGGTDAINFLNQYQQAGADTNLIGGSIMADQTVLTSKGRAKDALIGTPTSGLMADANPDQAWLDYVTRYQEAFPEGERLPSPSLFGVGYYLATKAALQALDEVEGDLSNGQEKFKAALSKLELDSPLGKITLNENRQAVGPVFVNEVVDDGQGGLKNEFKKRIDGVDQTHGLTPEQFDELVGLPSRDAVDCEKLRNAG